MDPPDPSPRAVIPSGRPVPSRAGRHGLGSDLAGGESTAIVRRSPSRAGVAQLVERRICNPQVTGSSPLASSIERTAESDRDRARDPGASRGERRRRTGLARRRIDNETSNPDTPCPSVAGKRCPTRNGDGLPLPFFPRVHARGPERYRSGQTGQTVNLLAHAFGGSNPPLSTRASGGEAGARSEPQASGVHRDAPGTCNELFGLNATGVYERE